MNDTTPVYNIVYQTICQINGKSYIGVHKTTDLNNGYIGCGVFRKNDANKNFLFHKAVRKHGYENFRRYVLDFYDTYEDALLEEKYLVTKEWVKDSSNYNSALGGKGSPFYFMDEEVREDMYKRISISRKGNKPSPESILKGIETRKRNGLEYTQERKDKISAALFGKKLSEDHKRKLSDKNAHYWAGKKRLESTKLKLSIAHTGKILSSSHRQKLSTSHLGQVSVQRKPIDKFSLSGEFIASYESIEKAALSVGCLSTSICNNLKKRSQNCSGFIFKYKEEGGTNCQ